MLLIVVGLGLKLMGLVLQLLFGKEASNQVKGQLLTDAVKAVISFPFKIIGFFIRKIF
jgi:hypothetical protein